MAFVFVFRRERALILAPDLKYLPPLSLKSSIQSCLSKIPDALLYDNTATLHGSEVGSSTSQVFRRQRPHTDPLLSLNQCKAQIDGFANAQDRQKARLSGAAAFGFSDTTIGSALRSVVTEANLLIEQLNTDWRQYVEDVIKEKTDLEIQDLGIDLACSLDAKYHAGNIDNGSKSRLRDSDLSLSYEPDSMEPDYRISDHIPRSATQAGGRDSNSLNSPSMNRGSLNMGKSKEDQGQSWPYVEPLRIAYPQPRPSPGCDTASSKAKLRQRLAMLHYERMYYRRLANEAVVRFVPTIKHHVHEVRNLLHEYSAEENRLRGLLQQQINLRTTQHPNGDG
ncbi:hypothetical protein FocTR4_00012102 [Fusarium oxysporum f. sp. cubense]|uniref:Uncharacterized protein n=1 Tax=Fusarium oxysporum f. sp. cubense TaxID=61366 RepID=A0A5C6SDC2_FUSOC|nr:hypothetical protein FocTR4_00012102 [Fusarium oxysporum f. sp. cubense]